MEWRPASPREAALRLLRTLFRDEEHPGVGAGLGLTAFQRDAAARARAILDRRGGVVVADSVGLGKTFVALALIADALREGGEAVVVVPAALRPMWRRQLGRLSASAAVRVVSHTQLSRGGHAALVRERPERPGPDPRLVVVDEAHAFRNPATRRYQALAEVAAGARLVLLTATPVNNRLADLHHLLRLFLADDAFHDLGIASLRECFDGAGDARGHRRARELDAVHRALDQVVLRRTRGLLRARYGAVAMTGIDGSFPRRAPPDLVRYADPALPDLLRGLARLELGAHGQRNGRGDGAAELVRLSLLKRLDSGRAGFRRSLRRLMAWLESTAAAARAGRLPEPRTRRGRRRGDPEDDPLQLVLGPLVQPAATPDIDLEALAASAEHDLGILRRLLAVLDGRDPKLDALRRLLDRLAPDKVVVFTEYRDTAAALWRALTPAGRVGRVDGSGAWLGRKPAGRRVVIERFAPRANGRPPPPPRERVDRLIATDVLAEGLNLQDARHVVSYDLPWNPVRLLQRIGRVDRLGSPHDVVVPHLFLPDDGLDDVLRLTRRIRRKVGAMAASVGLEDDDRLLAALARGPAATARALGRLGDGRMDVPLERLGATARGTGVERPGRTGHGNSMERLRTLYTRHREDSPGRPPPLPLVASITLPDELGATDIVLAFESHDGPAVIEVDDRGVAHPAGFRTVRAVEHAMESPAAGPKASPAESSLSPEIRRAEARARDYFRALGRAAAAPPPLPPGALETRLARRLRVALARAGIARDPDITARTDRLLRRLSRPLPPAARHRAREAERAAGEVGGAGGAGGAGAQSAPGGGLRALVERLEALPWRPPLDSGATGADDEADTAAAREFAPEEPRLVVALVVRRQAVARGPDAPTEDPRGPHRTGQRGGAAATVDEGRTAR